MASTHPLVNEKSRGEHVEANKTDLHPVNLATGPETTSSGTTAQTNPTIVNPPSHGYPAVTSASQPATAGNLPTSQHPVTAGPHPPIDATHHTEQVVPVNNPVSSALPASNRLKRLERGHLTDLGNMLSLSYSNTDSFIILPSTEEEDPKSHLSGTADSKIDKDLKKDQQQLDKLNKRRDYIFKKIARGLLKKDAAWGLFDETHTHLQAAAILIPPAREPTQNSNQLRLEDPKINEGHSSHYVPIAPLFTKKNPKQLVLLGPSLIKRIRLELRLFDTAMTVHQRPDVAFLYFFGDLHTHRVESHDIQPTRADQSLTQTAHPKDAISNLSGNTTSHVNTLLSELGKRFPMIVTTERYRDNSRFLMLLKNGFQEIDKVQGFRERYAEGEAHVVAPGIGTKQIAHGREGPDHLYESCFITLAKGIYPSLKNVENDVRGVVPQKQAAGIISDPTTVLPPAHIPTSANTTAVHPAHTTTANTPIAHS